MGEKETYVHIITNNGSVFFRKRLEDNLTTIYKNLDSEVAFCLHGERREDSLFVNEASLPRIISSTDSTAKVDSDVCKNRDGFLGLVHNHKNVYISQCRPSVVDLKRFVLTEDAIIEVIACQYPTNVGFFVLVKESKNF